MGQTGVTKSVEGGKSYFGTPIQESREKLKQLANIKKIEELQKTNKKGKNKGEIIKLLNENQKVNKEIAIERAKQNKK